MFEHLARAAMVSVLEDESLYDSLSDYEVTILVRWAEDRIALALSGALNEAVARKWSEREVARLRSADKAIADKTRGVEHWNRDVAIAVATAILSETWNDWQL